MTQQKGKLGVVEFGRQLIETGDLDPLYIALWKARLPHKKLCQWLVCYFCYYHAGLSSWVVDQLEQNEWDILDKIARGGTAYPRGSERRHFRGQLAIKAVEKLRSTFSDGEELIRWVGDGGPRANGVMSRVRSLYGFGEWISGKVPDICERLKLFPVKFVDRDIDYMFDSPKKGAIEVANRYAPSDDPLMSAHRYLIQQLSSIKAPPRYERGINVQETETIFCKVHAYWNGTYEVGKDTREIRHGLLRYARSKTSQILLRTMPSVVVGG
jgi:hypothetical protein